MESTVKCPLCGDPYKFYAFSAADQSACPDCVRKAEDKMRGGPIKGNWEKIDIKNLISPESVKELNKAIEENRKRSLDAQRDRDIIIDSWSSPSGFIPYARPD